MSATTKSGAGDLIVEPIAEAVALYDELLEQLREFMATHEPVPKEFGAVELATFLLDVLQGPEYRPFAKLSKRPGSDSLRVFNHIVLKISQQSIRTCDAMLPHLIYKITNVCEPPVNTPENSLDATSAVLFEAISHRLQLGNDLHMTFKRVGRTTIDCLERLKEQNEEWSSVWNGGLKQFEPETVKLGLNQIKNAMLNLERMMLVASMSDENYGTLTEWGWFPHEPCYVAALHTTARTPSPKPPVDEFDVENEYDPVCRSLREQSQSLKWSFQKQSTEYDMLKYEFRRVSVIYDTYYRSDYNTESTILATEEISEVERDTLRSIQARLYYENLQQKQFFGRYVERARAIFEQLEVLYESSDVLLDKLRVLHYPVDEVRHIARRDKLFHAQKSLDFVIKERHQEVSAFLSSRLADAGRAGSNQALRAPVSPSVISPDRDVPFQAKEAIENPDLNESLRAGLSLQLGLTVSRFRVIEKRRESTSAQLTWLKWHDTLLLRVAKTLRRVSGESEVVVSATDAEFLDMVQNALVLSDAIKKEFDMAMSELKACCNDLDKIEQETAEFLKSFETISAGFKSALTAVEISVLHTLRVVPGEFRLRRAKILTEVRSYW
ncbi:hypothetical protein KCU95_g5407, partial [Aureobasidium melanogenum]